MNVTRRSLAALAGIGAMVGVSCYDLDITAVQPTTTFTREQVLAKPELIELVVAGVFINFWGGATYPQPWLQLSLYGEEITTSANTSPNFNRGTDAPIILWDFAQEPRLAFDNSITGTSFFARDPWSNFYEANAAATDMPRLIKERNLKIIDPATKQDNTFRVLTFGKWIQGLSHAHLAMLFDQAAIVNETVDLSKVSTLPLVSHTVVRDSAIKWLEESITMAKSQSFSFPLKADLWVYNTPVSNDELAAIANSYIARTIVYSARTPAERAAIDWAKVKTHIQAGVTGPFGPRGLPNPIIAMDYRAMMSAPPQNTAAICTAGGTNFCGSHAGVARVDLRLLGPADTSGAYQTWLQKVSAARFDTVMPFIVRTPDKRIQPQNGTVPLVKPMFFKFTDVVPPATIQLPERGPYYYSNYWTSSRALNNNQQLPLDGGGRARRNINDLGAIQDAMLLPVEMDLLLAEAEYNLGNLAAAATLINKSRVANGELPPVTAAGVPASTPTAGCVPRRWDGACGTLFDALMYEKRIETYGTAISYFDLRGWGCLLEGTPLELPPPGRQLELLGVPQYTFGGVGMPGGAPKPTNCPLLHRP
jgi:hypothetical protein